MLDNTSSVSDYSEPIFEAGSNSRDGKRSRSRSRKRSSRRKADTAAFVDRSDDVASLYLMNRLAWPIVVGMLVVVIASWCSPFFLKNFTMPSGAVLMGMWIIWFIAATFEYGGMTIWQVLTFVLMIAFDACALVPMLPMWIVIATLIILLALLQVILLIWTIWSCPAAETDSQEVFFGTLTGVCAIATTTSLVFLYKSFHYGPSPESFYSAVAGTFCFAYGTFVSALVRGTRGRCDDPIKFSCHIVSNCTDSCCCTSFLPILVNVGLVVAFVLLWPPPESLDSRSWIGGSVYPCALGAMAMSYQGQLVKARRFHVRSDASILVETMSKTYVYDRAIHAFLEPLGGSIPRQTTTCHVYCERSTVPIVVVELVGGRLLCLTPDLPTEFAKAVSRAVARNNV